MPVPMMPPMPSRVRCVAFRARCSWLPEDSCSCSSAMDLVARSWLAMSPPVFREDSTQAPWGKRASRRRRALPRSRHAQLRRQVRREQLDERSVNLRRAGDDVSRLAVLRAAQGADAPPGLLDEQRSGCRVPGTQTDFPERINAASGDIGEIERGSARPAYTGRVQRHGPQHLEIGIEITGVGTIRKTGGDECPFEGACLADAHAAIVEMRTGAAAGGEQLLAH